jgi:hypothetical protein
MQVLRLTLLLAVSVFAAAQSPPPPLWQMQESGTTAGLRGIDSVDGTVAWASGTGGTVLKTIDGGAHWTQCAVPDAAKDGATLDFRGVQAWDAKTAIVMASGPGEKSRLYRTMDGCKSWTLLLKNTEPQGFWDAIRVDDYDNDWVVLGDPVDDRFVIQQSRDHGQTWRSFVNLSRMPTSHSKNESVFAASNSSLYLNDRLYSLVFVTGGTGKSEMVFGHLVDYFDTGGSIHFHKQSLPVTHGLQSTGAFSFAYRYCLTAIVNMKATYCPAVVVGGDYQKPEKRDGTAAYALFSALLGKSQEWHEAQTPPHGFRSAVQWSEALKAWITVGTNGSDISRDDGKTWQPLDDGNWNALSLPFVVGPNGRIARINPAALPHEQN